MKKIATLLMLLSLSVFSIGCNGDAADGDADVDGAAVDADGAAADADGAAADADAADTDAVGGADGE